MEYRKIVRDGMRIEYNVPIQMEDGAYVMSNIYHPLEEGVYPAILSYGCYGKDLAFQDHYTEQWNEMISNHPEVGSNSSCVHQSWETVDPEKWCPDGYICIRVDSRGAGCTSGYMDPFSPRETKDIYNCIEWAAAQSWCSGKVGMNGISYFAVNQWQVAELQPPHLSAICVWEGNCDYYRELTHQGGILCVSQEKWQLNQGNPIQYGLGDRGYKSRVTGMNVSGDETLTERQLRDNRCDMSQEIFEHPLYDQYYRDRNVGDFSKIKTPLLSAGNWGGQGLHLRGNVEGFLRAASTKKWLEIHGDEHWTRFYCDDGIALQKQFFGYFLKGEKNGWDKRRKCQLKIRHIDHFEERWEDEWPIARTQYQKLYLTPDYTLTAQPQEIMGTITYQGMGDGITFLAQPFEQETEITGHSLVKLFLSSSTSDADLFVVLRLFSPDMTEVTFPGANEPYCPIAQGWLRASHRKKDKARSTEYRPFYSHDELWPLTPGEPVELDVDFYPTCIVAPAGYRLALTVRGKDYVYSGASRELRRLSEIRRPGGTVYKAGCGGLQHDDPRDRPKEIFDGQVTMHFGPDCMPYLQIPVIPAR